MTKYFALLVWMIVPSVNAISIETVPVGNPSEGGVDYSYRISKYEITNSQYVELLNAIPQMNYNLYWSGGGIEGIECANNGGPGWPTFTVVPGYENRPVTNITYFSACVFVNWLNMTHGAEPAYYVAGNGDLRYNTVPRNPNARWFIPTEEEWVKAAYYDPAKKGFWTYPTRSDVIDKSMANYASSSVVDVGSYPNHPSAYGTFDQGGNANEWVDKYYPPAGWSGVCRGEWGGSYWYGTEDMSITYNNKYAFDCDPDLGFRIVEVPEPATAMLLIMGSAVVYYGTRRHSCR